MENQGGAIRVGTIYHRDDVDKRSSNVATPDTWIADCTTTNQLRQTHCFPFSAEILVVGYFSRAPFEWLVQSSESDCAIIEMACLIDRQVLCALDVGINLVFAKPVEVEV